MAIENLEILADYLEREVLPKGSRVFDMEWIANIPPVARWEFLESLYASGEREGEILEMPCGSTACMLGWGAVCPELKAKGFRLVISNHGSRVVVNGRFSWDNLANFFGLTEREYRDLFYYCPDDTRHDLAYNIHRVRDLIAKKRQELGSMVGPHGIIA